MVQIKYILLFQTVVLILFNGSTFAQNACSDILQWGIYDNYDISSEQEFDYLFTELVKMDKEQLKNDIDNKTLDVGIPIPLAESFVKFDASFSNNEETYRRLKESYESSTYNKISSSDRQYLYAKIVNEDIVNAWQTCISNPSTVKLDIQGNIKSTFSLSIKYGHSDGALIDRKITGVNYSNLSIRGDTVFKIGKILKPLNTYSQIFERVDSSDAFIVLNLENYTEPVTFSLPSIPPPSPVYEVDWYKRNESGELYSETFRHISEDRHNKGAKIAGGKYYLSDKTGQIYKIDFTHKGGGCGWNYHPVDGYGKWVKILQPEKNGFEWKRKWDGKPCEEFYTAFYMKKRGKCVENCK